MSLEETVEFADNPDPRCPCVLLLDTSGSMASAKIDALNDGLKTFKAAVMKNDLAKKRVEIAIVAFDSTVKLIQDFVTVGSIRSTNPHQSGTHQYGSRYQSSA